MSCEGDNIEALPLPGIERFQNKIRTTEDFTVWYRDCRCQAAAPLIPPTNHELQDGDLYLLYSGNVVVSIWIRLTNEHGPVWGSAYKGIPHPTISGRVLGFKKDGCPTWLKPESVARYNRHEKGNPCFPAHFDDLADVILAGERFQA